MVDTLKSRIIAILGLILVSTIVIGLTDVLNFENNVQEAELTFSWDSIRNVSVNLWNNSYVMNSTLTITGLLSDWVTELFYDTLNVPVSGKYISDNKWLISDEYTDAVYLVDPSDGSSVNTSGKVALNNPKDAEYITDTLWYIADYTNDRVVLYNAMTQSFDWTYNITDPSDVDLVVDDLILISANLGGGNREVRLVNTTSNATIESVTNIKTVYDAEYISNNLWLIADTDNKIKAINPIGDILLWEFAIDQPKAIDYLTDNISLVIDGGLDYIFMVNFSDGNYLMNYSGADKPVDADYISDTEWLITDKDGSRKVSFEKKYYPTDLNFSIGGIEVWSMVGELNGIAQINGFSQIINQYLETCSIVNGNCIIPFVFHSTTHGRLNVTNLNISVDRKPEVIINQPNNNVNWSGMQNISWTTTDDDDDQLTMRIYYWDETQWKLLDIQTAAPGPYDYMWNTSNATPANLNNSCKIMLNVTDSYAPAKTAESNPFTIDNTNPTITVNYPNGGENITGNVNIQWTANDNFDEDLTISIEYTDDNGATWQTIPGAVWDTAGINSQQVKIRINATDNAGNKKTDESDNVFTVDNTAPIVTLNSPTGFLNTIPLNFNFTVIDSINLNLNCYLYTDESGTLQNVSEMIAQNNTNTVFVYNMTDGNYFWNVNCSDGLNSALAAANFSIDLDTQVLAPTYFPNTTITTTTATIRARFDEVVNLTNSTYAIFDNQIINMTTLDHKTFTYNANNLGNGNRQLILNATDLHNNNKIFTKDFVVSIPTNNPGQNPGGGGGCTPSWSCTPWSICSSEGKQTRTCTDLRNCGTPYNKPAEEQTCTYIPIRNMNFTMPEEVSEEENLTEEEQTEEESGLGEITGGFAGFFETGVGKLVSALAVLLLVAGLTTGYVMIKRKRNLANIKPPEQQK